MTKMVFDVEQEINIEELSAEEKRRYLREKCGLTAALQQREVVTLGELPLHLEIYASEPAHPVVIFLPGIGTYCELYAKFLLEFSQRGYNMVGLDIRGHGYSGGAAGDYRVEQITEDIRQVVEYCRQRFNTEIHIWGNSLGAILGLAATEDIKSIKSIMCHTLCTASCPPSYIHWQGWQNLNTWKWFMPWQKLDFRQFIDIKNLLHETPLVGCIEHDDKMIWEYTIGTLADVYNYRHRSVYKKLDFKMALIVGENDNVLSPSYEKNLIDDMVHPVDFIGIENAGHMLPFTHAKETIDVSVNWLQQQISS